MSTKRTPTVPLPLLPRVARMAVEPGDVIVIECSESLNLQQHRIITEQLERIWPLNRSLILDGGKQLKIGTETRRRARGRTDRRR